MMISIYLSIHYPSINVGYDLVILNWAIAAFEGEGFMYKVKSKVRTIRTSCIYVYAVHQIVHTERTLMLLMMELMVIMMMKVMMMIRMMIMMMINDITYVIIFRSSIT